jgi:hypothetical protein
MYLSTLSHRRDRERPVEPPIKGMTWHTPFDWACLYRPVMRSDGLMMAFPLASVGLALAGLSPEGKKGSNARSENQERGDSAFLLMADS